MASRSSRNTVRLCPFGERVSHRAVSTDEIEFQEYEHTSRRHVATIVIRKQPRLHCNETGEPPSRPQITSELGHLHPHQRKASNYRLLRSICNANCSSSSSVGAAEDKFRRGFFAGGLHSSSRSDSDGKSNSGETYPSSSESSAIVGPSAPPYASPSPSSS